MDIRTSPSLPTVGPAPAAPGAALKPGEVIAAVVEARLSATSFLLQIQPGGQRVVAQSHTELTPGAHLTLEVVKTGATPELRPVAPGAEAAAPRAATAPGDTPQNRALREFLPKQIDLAELMGGLSALDRGGAMQTLPAPVRQALAAVLAAFPSQHELATPAGLLRAVRDSGVFFEARLAAAAGIRSEFPDGDFKGRLLALLDQLQTLRAAPPVAEAGAPPPASARPLPDPNAAAAWADPAAALASKFPVESAASPAVAGSGADMESVAALDAPKPEALAHKVEGALARIGLDQLASLPQADGAPLWRLEIPYTADGHGDTAKLLVGADGKRGSGGETLANWSVNLELHPPGLGSFCARIVWTGGRIDTYLWSDSAGTVGLMESHREQLRARLELAGLVVGRLAALAQAPPKPRPDPPAAPLLDLRA